MQRRFPDFGARQPQVEDSEMPETTAGRKIGLKKQKLVETTMSHRIRQFKIVGTGAMPEFRSRKPPAPT